jgi:hypothetical protein
MRGGFARGTKPCQTQKWIQLVQLMATETRTDPRKNFVPRFLPWLLAAAMLLVYWLTLNRWVSLVQPPPWPKFPAGRGSRRLLNPDFISGHVSVPLAAAARFRSR